MKQFCELSQTEQDAIIDSRSDPKMEILPWRPTGYSYQTNALLSIDGVIVAVTDVWSNAYDKIACRTYRDHNKIFAISKETAFFHQPLLDALAANLSAHWLQEKREYVHKRFENSEDYTRAFRDKIDAESRAREAATIFERLQASFRPTLDEQQAFAARVRML